MLTDRQESVVPHQQLEGAWYLGWHMPQTDVPRRPGTAAAWGHGLGWRCYDARVSTF